MEPRNVVASSTSTSEPAIVVGLMPAYHDLQVRINQSFVCPADCFIRSIPALPLKCQSLQKALLLRGMRGFCCLAAIITCVATRGCQHLRLPS
eukprot:300302-Pelagomonas_calceolata.AAC.4